MAATPDVYNFTTYRPGMNMPLRRAFQLDPPVRVGDPAPRFRLRDLDGGTVDSGALRENHHMVVVFGCFSAPPTVLEMPAIDALAAETAQTARFVFVYTREAHPGERLPPHRSLEQKLDHARRFRDHLGLRLPVVVDELDGAIHLAYGGLPFMAVVAHRDGTVVHRAEWAEARDIRSALDDLADRDANATADEPGRIWFTETLRYTKRPPRETFADLLALAGDQAVVDNLSKYE